jgi:hypothetical protein
LIAYADGSIYEGHIENGLPQGTGRLTLADLTVQEGMFEQGKMTKGNTSVEIQQVNDQKPSNVVGAQANIKPEDKKADKANEENKKADKVQSQAPQQPNPVLEKSVKPSVSVGQAAEPTKTQPAALPISTKLDLGNGFSYEGGLLDGKPNGKGKMTNAKGYLYEGEFKAGKKEGQGECTYEDGNKYKGKWMNDLEEGQAEMIFANGRVYNGPFLNGKMHGIGKLKLPNGSSCEGAWVNGLQEGKAIMKSPGSDAQIVVFKGGVMAGNIGRLEEFPDFVVEMPS